MTRPSDIDALLRRFPLGARLRGRVRPHPGPPIGVFVDLAPGDPDPGCPEFDCPGFVDRAHLRGRDQWPPAGTVTDFEVLSHLHNRLTGRWQIRLWPLDPALHDPDSAHRAFPEEQWQRSRARHPVGSTVTATVTSAGPGNHWYTVTFGEAWARVGYPAAGAPPPGHAGRYRVTALLESTHRVLLAPLDGPVNLDHPYG